MSLNFESLASADLAQMEKTFQGLSTLFATKHKHETVIMSCQMLFSKPEFTKREAIKTLFYLQRFFLSEYA